MKVELDTCEGGSPMPLHGEAMNIMKEKWMKGD